MRLERRKTAPPLRTGRRRLARDGRLGKAGLSVREVDVLKLIANGLSNKEVANELGVTEATAKKHMTSVLLKLGAKDRTHAVKLGLERGTISLDS